MTKVLLVDDDKVASTAITAVLEQNCLKVFNASTLTEAVKLIVAEKFDVLLSDLHMPRRGRRAHGCRGNAPGESSCRDNDTECISRYA